MIRHLVRAFAHLGAPGLLALSAFDSSPVFIPFGNDLLFIVLAARKHQMMVYYALMATIGSVLGCLLDDVLSRKGGEKGLEKSHWAHSRLASIRKYTKKNAGWALGIASLMPPPFPFTVFVAGAAAMQYPRKKLLLVVALARLGRFLIEGLLAIYLGSRLLLNLVRSPVMDYLVGTIVVASIVGSILSLRGLARGKRA